ncbi:helix-turn-helix domain-containing protein [Parabacteroides sp.]
MKHFTLTLILYLILPVCIKAQNTPDSLFTREYIQSISLTDPHRALDLLNEAEKDKRIPEFLINNLRSLVYHNGLGQYRVALDYALKAYQSDSIQKSPERALSLIDIIASDYMSIGNYIDCIRYSNIGVKLAQQIEDKSLEAGMWQYIGLAKQEMGLKAEAETYFIQAIKTQKEVAKNSQDWKEIDDLIYSYGTLIMFYMENRKHKEAIALLPDYDKLMVKLGTCPNLPEGVCDMRYSSLYAAFANIYALDGELGKAKQYYKKYLQTNYSSTPEGRGMRIDYLLNTGQYQEALLYIKKDKQDMIAAGDTMSNDYTHYTLRHEAEAYIGLKNYQAAAENYKKMFILSDSLNSNEKQNTALELATLYETNEKDLQIKEQRIQLHQTRIILIAATGMFILSLIIIWLIVHNLRVSRRKNRIMAGQIDELLASHDSLLKAKEEIRTLSTPLLEKNKIPQEEPPLTDATETVMQALFEELDTLVTKEQLFLNPDINRDMLTKRMHIQKNVFAQIIQLYGHTNFNGYINNKRLEYSIRLLKDYHNYTIQAVANDSGFNNVRTYYRTFREKYGMSPAEYRDTPINNNKKEPCINNLLS